MDGVVQELEMMCTQRNDHVSCLKFKVLRLLDEMFKQDSYKVSTQNNRQNFIKLDIAWSSAWSAKKSIDQWRWLIIELKFDLLVPGVRDGQNIKLIEPVLKIILKMNQIYIVALTT